MPKTVLATGTFDILHPGHLHYLTSARALGARLVVIVAHDKTAAKHKGGAVFSATDRAALVGALKVVDEAIVGDPNDHFKIVKAIQPAIIALGHDQPWRPEDLQAALKKIGLTPSIVRIDSYVGELSASRQVVEKIRST